MKTKSPLLAAAIIVCCLVIGFGAGFLFPKLLHRSGEYTLTILNTTDIHGNYFDSLYNATARKTSMANVASYIRNVRDKEHSDPVLIDCGDNLQGDNAAYYYNYVNTKADHIVTKIFKYLDYDAIVVGNHDIETGHPVYDRVSSASDIPYLAANAVYSTGRNQGEPYFEPYTVVRRHGLKIAVIGMTNANIKSWLSEEIWEGVDFVQISDIAQDLVDEVRKKEDPDIVILAVHSGTGSPGPSLKGTRQLDLVAEPDLESEAFYLATNVKGVDIVLSGHDHAPIAFMVATPDGEVAYMNAGRGAQFVGRCDVKLSLKKGKIEAKNIECKVVPMENIEPDKEYCDKFRPEFEEVKAFANQKIGNISGDLVFDTVLEGPTAYMTLVHTVQLESTGADVSISAPLSTKGRIEAGTVTFQDLTRIYVYENTLFVIEMTGEQLKDYLEYSYDNWVGMKGPTFNFDSAQGIDYEVSRKAKQGERVKILGMSDGRPFEMDKVYKVAMTSYRANGGGELLRKGAGIDPKDLVITGKYKDIRGLIGDYITSHGEIEPTTASNWKFVD